ASRYLVWNSAAEPLLPPASYAAQKCERSDVTIAAAAGSVASTIGPELGEVASCPPHADSRTMLSAQRKNLFISQRLDRIQPRRPARLAGTTPNTNPMPTDTATASSVRLTGVVPCTFTAMLAKPPNSSPITTPINPPVPVSAEASIRNC